MRNICLFLFFVSCSCILNAQPLTYSVHHTNVSCDDNHLGSIEITNVSGCGNGSATFCLTDANGNPLSDERRNAKFDNLTAGVYRILIKVGGACETLTGEIVIRPPGTLEINVFQSKLAGCDDNVPIGAITVVPTDAGGSDKLRYRLGGNGDWRDEEALSGLKEGSYTVTAIDDNECISQQKEIFVRKAQQPSLKATGSIIPCFSDNNQFGSYTGTIDADAVAETDLDGTPGRVEHYQLFTSDGKKYGDIQSHRTFDRLTAGEYTVCIKDGYSCENQANAVVIGPESQIDISLFHVVPPDGNHRGSITVAASGGWGHYTIVCNKVVASIYYLIHEFKDVAAGNYTVDNLETGTYQFTISDKEGCACLAALVIDLDQFTGEIEPDASGFYIYPNPSSNGRFIIEWNNREDRVVTLEVYNMSGQLLHKTGAKTSVRTMLDLRTRNQSTYLLYIPELNIRQKLTVQD